MKKLVAQCIVLVACGSSERAVVAPVTSASATASAVAAPPQEPSNLARSSVAHAAVPAAGLRVKVTPSELRLADEKIADVPIAHDKPNALVVPPLYAKLEGPHAPEAVVFVDARVSYRTLVEVLYTLGQREVGTYWLVVSSPRGERAIQVTPPRMMAMGPFDPDAKSNLTALVVSDGISLKARGGNVAPGCTDVGPGIAIGKKSEQYDFESLTKCAAHLQATVRMTDTVIIAANPSIEFQTIVSTIDAVAPSFPVVQFGVAR